MAIYINHPNNPNQRLDSPEVRITGKRVDTLDGSVDSIVRIYSRDHERIIGNETQKEARDVDARTLDTYRRSVTITILPDSSNRKGFQNNQAVFSKAASELGVFVGEQDTGITKNETMYTYYTLNGKDPRRTKANLYTKAFTVRQNKSGGDNYILKVRSYINGIASRVRRVDFRIVDDQVNYRNINKLTREANG